MWKKNAQLKDFGRLLGILCIVFLSTGIFLMVLSFFTELPEDKEGWRSALKVGA